MVRPLALLISLAVFCISPAYAAGPVQCSFSGGFFANAWKTTLSTPIEETALGVLVERLEHDLTVDLVNIGHRPGRRLIKELMDQDLDILLLAAEEFMPLESQSGGDNTVLLSEPVFHANYVVAHKKSNSFPERVGMSYYFKAYPMFTEKLISGLPGGVGSDFIPFMRTYTYLSANPRHGLILDRDQLDTEGEIRLDDMVLVTDETVIFSQPVRIAVQSASPCGKYLDGINQTLRTLKAGDPDYIALLKERRSNMHAVTRAAILNQSDFR